MTSELPFLDRLNYVLTRAWAGGWWPDPTLDGPTLEREACRRERTDTIPGDKWREPFRVLLADLEESADLTPLGRQIANGQMVGLLRARIRAERLLRDRAEILERPVRAPVIVFGPMRSGTTRMHRLLACDPQFAHTRLFESLEPVPFGLGIDRRMVQAAAVQRFLRQANPALAHIHPTGPLQPEEEFGLHSFSFHGAQFEVQWRVPRYRGFVRQADPAQAYREFRFLLQIMGWSRRADPGKPWLLKSPQFTAEPQALLQAFPDARLICLHRDWAEVVGSAASLVWNQRRVHSSRADKQDVGQEWLAKTALRARQTTTFRRDHPQVPQIDVCYDEVSRDWNSAVRRVYEFLDLPLGTAVLDRMRRFMTESKEHRQHRYTLEEFGLDRSQLDEAFRELSCVSG